MARTLACLGDVEDWVCHCVIFAVGLDWGTDGMAADVTKKCKLIGKLNMGSPIVMLLETPHKSPVHVQPEPASFHPFRVPTIPDRCMF